MIFLLAVRNEEALQGCMSIAESRDGEANTGQRAKGSAAPLLLPTDQFRGLGGS